MQDLFSLLPSLLLIVLASGIGVLLTNWMFEDADWQRRLCAGAVLGLAGLAWIGFLWALLLGLNWVSISLTALTLLGLGFFLRSGLSTFARPAWNLSSVLYYGGWTLFFVWLFSRVISLEADGLHTAPANNYGDLAFHFSVVTSFADGANLPPRNPIFHGLNFTYPFLIDFLTAFLHRAGAAWAAAFFLPNVVLSLALVGLLVWLTEELTQNRFAARLAPVLFFLSGGLGFCYFFRDWQQTDQRWLDFLLHLPQSYTKNDELNLEWGNMLTTLLVPQRSLLFGIPVFALIVLLWHKACLSPSPLLPFSLSPFLSLSPPRRKYLLIAGILAGFLPFLHAHGFLSLMLVSLALAAVFFSWDWLAFFIPAGVLALPQALWLSTTGTKSSLFKPHLGWAKGEAGFPEFLALNFGLFLLTLLAALYFQPARTRRFYVPFLLCFLVPNVVLLAPWPWDNIKVLLYWYLLSVPLVAALLAQLFQRRKMLWSLLSAVIFGALIFSGALDVARGLSPIEKLRLFDAEQLKVAELIKQRIPPRALVLSAPIHNSVLALSGRPMLLGYPGHLWSHGIKFEDRERDVKTMYQGGAAAEWLLQHYGIEYVIVGPVEYNELNADEGYFAEKYEAVIDDAGYRVYQIRSAAKN